MSGIPVERCSQCAKGYFRVGGRCEVCPTDILLLAVLFLCGVVGMCVVGYVLHAFKVNLAMAAIGIDYAQVMSMFLKSDIRWPNEVRTLFRLLSSFNFDLDVASPECLVQEYYRYDIKWFSIMALPLGMASIFLFIHFLLYCKKRFLERRTSKLNKHAHSMVSMNLVMMYFLYLYLTRSALDVFNCVSLDPPDRIHPEYTYMTAVGGVRCYEEGSLQMQLLPYAVLGILFYTMGYPAILSMIMWRNKIRIQRDQYLRSSGLGDKRDPTDLYNVYNIRKRYSALYYQFKPRCYYWTVVIIARKFSIAAINLMLRSDVDYMLAASLLVMFCSFSLQLLNRPFMGPAEYRKVRDTWGERTAVVSTAWIDNAGASTGGGGLGERRGFDSTQRMPAKSGEGSRAVGRTTMAKLKMSGVSSGKKLTQWLVNYNTVESILLFCSVLIMLGGIMFSSSRFDNNKNLSELQTLTWLVSFVFLCFFFFFFSLSSHQILFIISTSLIYYGTVLFLEIVAQTCPNRCCCDLGKHLGDGFVERRQKRKIEKRKSQTEGVVEMRAMHDNPHQRGAGDPRTKSPLKKSRKIGRKKGRTAKPALADQSSDMSNDESEAQWSSHVDKNTGKKYFSNQDTGRVTWTDHTVSDVDVEIDEKKKMEAGSPGSPVIRVPRGTIQSAEKV
jgi:hypothetical protein